MEHGDRAGEIDRWSSYPFFPRANEYFSLWIHP
jgi:hypothetical protein